MGAEENNIQHEELEKWLDDALRARATAEPRVGLEERVLARLAAEPPRTFSWWRVMAPVAVLLAVAIALAVWTYRRPEHPARSVAGTTTPPVVNLRPLKSPEVAAARRNQVTPRPAARREIACCAPRKSPQVREEDLPKLATFPAPSPESAEERLLKRLAARKGSIDMASLEAGSEPIHELSVPAVVVEPMDGTPPDESPR
ncbi:MAG: hypothetical protein JOZ10_14830 [Acidobacteria bacterium]|nr:hypothetical protein [Acidobacteriota bacterium]